MFFTHVYNYHKLVKNRKNRNFTNHAEDSTLWNIEGLNTSIIPGTGPLSQSLSHVWMMLEDFYMFINDLLASLLISPSCVISRNPGIIHFCVLQLSLNRFMHSGCTEPFIYVLKIKRILFNYI